MAEKRPVFEILNELMEAVGMQPIDVFIKQQLEYLKTMGITDDMLESTFKVLNAQVVDSMTKAFTLYTSTVETVVKDPEFLKKVQETYEKQQTADNE